MPWWAGSIPRIQSSDMKILPVVSRDAEPGMPLITESSSPMGPNSGIPIHL